MITSGFSLKLCKKENTSQEFVYLLLYLIQYSFVPDCKGGGGGSVEGICQDDFNLIRILAAFISG